MTKVSVEGVSAGEALAYLNDKVVGDQGGGVINFVIRGREVSDKSVTLKADKMNYAQAVDEICAQTGRQWQIEVDESSGVPVLVLTFRNNHQPVARPADRTPSKAPSSTSTSMAGTR